MATSALDQYVQQIRAWLYEFKTNEQIVTELAKLGVKTTESSIRRCIDRNAAELQEAAEIRTARNSIEQEAERPGYSYDEDQYEVTEPVKTLGDKDKWEDVSRLTIARVMARHALDPEVWECDRANPNVWQGQRKGGEIVNFYQFKLYFKKRVPISAVFPAYVPPKISVPKKPNRAIADTGIIVTDHQAPHINEVLHELTLRWIAYNQPTFGVIGGDLQDHGYIGRHRDDPAWDTTAQECIDSAFKVIWDYRNADEDTAWSLIKGNHDDRIRNEQLERNERLYGIRAAQWPGEEPEEYVYSLNHLLHLKDLGVEYVEPQGTYEFQQVPVTDLLSVRHGHKVVKGGAMKTANELGHSVVLGHTHRQSVTRQTLWNSITGKWNVVTAIEAGCMCQIEGGLGFANAGCPDWQPGFATVTRFPDGQFTFDLATFEQNGILRWRDQVYSI